jgi:hypothetical protein
MKILIHPWSRPLLNGGINPKNYSYWPELIKMLQKDSHKITQIGVEGEEKLVEDFRKDLPIKMLQELMFEQDFFISVDSFWPHFVTAYKIKKPGIVLWTVSNPEIFGYPQFLNLCQSKRYLREYQFDWIEKEPYHPNKSIKPEIVKSFIDKYFVV